MYQIQKTGCLLALLLSAGAVSAGGFQLWQQSGASIGDYAAGAAAVANDSATAYYNPAGMTRIKRQNMAFSVLGILTNVKFDGRLNTTPAIGNFINSGTTQGGESNIVPTILYVAPISQKWAFGFTYTSPFASKVNFSQSAFSRYTVAENTMTSQNYSPSLAYRPFHFLSLGAGVDAQRLKIKYERIDTANTTADDALNTNELTGWGYGWHAGLLWEISKKTRIGLSYRSKLVNHLSGNSRFYGTGGYGGRRTTSNVYLPPLAIFSIYQRFGYHLAIMGTVTYTQWTKLKDLTLNNVAGTSSSTNITLQDPMRNAWRFAMGAHYEISKTFLLRAGIGYDQTPTKNNTRNIIMPDADQFILAFGAGYKLSQKFSVDIGYSHAFIRHVSVDHQQDYTRENISVIGNLTQQTDLFGLQVNWLMT